MSENGAQHCPKNTAKRNFVQKCRGVLGYYLAKQALNALVLINELAIHPVEQEAE